MERPLTPQWSGYGTARCANGRQVRIARSCRKLNVYGFLAFPRFEDKIKQPQDNHHFKKPFERMYPAHVRSSRFSICGKNEKNKTSGEAEHFSAKAVPGKTSCSLGCILFFRLFSVEKTHELLAFRRLWLRANTLLNKPRRVKKHRRNDARRGCAFSLGAQIICHSREQLQLVIVAGPLAGPVQRLLEPHPFRHGRCSHRGRSLTSEPSSSSCKSESQELPPREFRKLPGLK
jgi:hypothetical protein